MAEISPEIPQERESCWPEILKRVPAKQLGFCRIVGCLNGVFFLADDNIGINYTFILWNPLINCFVHLPKPRICFDVIGPYIQASGFGYDCIKDDFKVVRIAYPRRKDHLDETPPRAELYSVREGKWRLISAENVEYCITDKEWTQCFIRERIHWIAYERWGEERRWSHKSTLLLLFNVVKENFQMMKLPGELREACPSLLSVTLCQGMLCVFHNKMNAGGMMHGNLMQFNLWVKKEYNVGSSWSKMASVDLTGGRVHKVLHWRNNGKLVALSRDRKIVSYDPETKSVAVLAKVDGLYYDAWSFVESLAFLNEDCKNKRLCICSRSYVPVEDGNSSSSDDEEYLPTSLDYVARVKTNAYMIQLDKYRKDF